MPTTVNTEINANYIPDYMLNSDGTVSSEYEGVASNISQGVSAIVADLPPADKAIFLMLLLALFNVTSEDEVAGWSADTISSELATVEDAAATIADLFESAGGIVDIMQVLAMLTFILETDSVDCRQRSQETSVVMSFMQANKLRRQGKKEYTRAMWSLVVQLVISFVSAVIAVKSFVNSVNQIAKSKDALANYQQSFNHEKISQSNSLEGDEEIQAAQKQSLSNSSKSFNLMGRANELDATKFEKMSNGLHLAGETFRSVNQVVLGMLNGNWERDIKSLQAQEIEYAALMNYFNSEKDIDNQFAENLYKFIDALVQFMEAILINNADKMQKVAGNIPG